MINIGDGNSDNLDKGDLEKNPERFGRIQFVRPLRDHLMRSLIGWGLAAGTLFAEVKVVPSEYPEPQVVLYPPDPYPRWEPSPKDDLLKKDKAIDF